MLPPFLKHDIKDSRMQKQARYDDWPSYVTVIRDTLTYYYDSEDAIIFSFFGAPGKEQSIFLCIRGTESKFGIDHHVRKFRGINNNKRLCGSQLLCKLFTNRPAYVDKLF